MAGICIDEDERLRIVLGPMVKEQLRIIMNEATSPK